MTKRKVNSRGAGRPPNTDRMTELASRSGVVRKMTIIIPEEFAQKLDDIGRDWWLDTTTASRVILRVVAEAGSKGIVDMSALTKRIHDDMEKIRAERLG